MSVIFDKWDSSKTTAPYFARSPHFWSSALKKRILKLHVLLVLVHAIPKCEYFYVFNESIKGNANTNIEGLRKSLLKHTEMEDGTQRRLPSTLYAQFDSACKSACLHPKPVAHISTTALSAPEAHCSHLPECVDGSLVPSAAADNKNRWMLGFLGLLVKQAKFADVYASMLIVGHTHEDIDAEFSIGSRYIYKDTGIIRTPFHFWETLREAYRHRVATFEPLVTVLDWIHWFGTNTVSSISGIGTERTSGFKRSPHAFWIHVNTHTSFSLIPTYDSELVHRFSIICPILNPDA